MPITSDEKKRIRQGAKAGDVYCRLMLAKWNGRGCRLSADDVCRLMDDTAMNDAAMSWGEEND